MRNKIKRIKKIKKKSRRRRRKSIIITTLITKKKFFKAWLTSNLGQACLSESKEKMNHFLTITIWAILLVKVFFFLYWYKVEFRWIWQSLYHET